MPTLPSPIPSPFTPAVSPTSAPPDPEAINAAPPIYQFVPHHVLTNAQLASPIRFYTASWTEVVGGIGLLEGTVKMPRKDRDEDVFWQIWYALEPGVGAMYVRNSRTGRYHWGGPIIKRSWNPDTEEVTVQAVEWKTFFYNVFLSPKADLTGDNLYDWTNQDQLKIARELVAAGVSGGATAGRITVSVGSETSGVLRDLHLKGLDFKYVGEAIDSMAGRSRGFDWDIKIGNNYGLPQLSLGLYYPQKGSQADGMVLRKTPLGGNFWLEEPVEESISSRVARVWATGSTETLPFAVDADPALADGGLLLTEKVTNYSTVTDRATLASHARAERAVLGTKIALLKIRTVEASAQGLSLTSASDTYAAGDRVRLVYSDSVYSLDLPSVRIVERKVAPFDGDGTITMTLDLSDLVLPEVDASGAVS